MWIWEQNTGRLRHDAALIGHGYSGSGQGVNNPALQHVPFVGPIPRGEYEIGPSFTHPHTGKITMRLTPRPGTDTLGRNEFMMHGNNATNTASHGCIVVDHDPRLLVAESHDRLLHVISV